jgi:hypothetical protein
MIGRRAVVLLAAAVLAGCSDNGSTVETSAPPAGAVGIVVVSFEEASSPVVGFIDPGSGRYLQGATLNIAPQSFTIADRGSVRIAPDWSRYAVTRQVGAVNHAGWVDPQAKFTDATGHTTPAGSADAIGFDGMGNFFYRVAANDQSKIYQVPTGQTSGGEPIPFLSATEGTVLNRDGTGRLVDVSACPTFAADWVSPSEYLHVSADGTQIFRTNVIDTPELRDCDAPIGIALLPPGETAKVSDPVASPDGTTVAYLRDDTELWLVDARGNGTPRRVEVSGVDLGAAHQNVIVGWAATTFSRAQSFSRKPDLAGNWNGDYFGPRLNGTGSASFHVDRSDPLSGSVVTRAGDLTCNSAAKETERTADSLAVEISLKAGADPRCKGASTIEFAWLGDKLSGVITQSSEPSYVGGTLVVRRQ